MTDPNINIYRELGAVQADIANLKHRQDQVELNVKNEINTLRNDIKDFKTNIHADNKSLEKTLSTKMDLLSDKLVVLEKFDNKQVDTWKTLTIVGTIAVSFVTFAISIYLNFFKH